MKSACPNYFCPNYFQVDYAATRHQDTWAEIMDNSLKVPDIENRARQFKNYSFVSASLMAITSATFPIIFGMKPDKNSKDYEVWKIGLALTCTALACTLATLFYFKNKETENTDKANSLKPTDAQKQMAHAISKDNQVDIGKAFSQAIDEVLEESKVEVTVKDIAGWSELFPYEMDQIKKELDVDYIFDTSNIPTGTVNYLKSTVAKSINSAMTNKNDSDARGQSQEVSFVEHPAYSPPHREEMVNHNIILNEERSEKKDTMNFNATREIDKTLENLSFQKDIFVDNFITLFSQTNENISKLRDRVDSDIITAEDKEYYISLNSDLQNTKRRIADEIDAIFDKNQTTNTDIDSLDLRRELKKIITRRVNTVHKELLNHLNYINGKLESFGSSNEPFDTKD